MKYNTTFLKTKPKTAFDITSQERSIYSMSFLAWASKIKAFMAPVNWTRFNKIYLFDILNNHVIQYPTPICLTYA